jgi:hypothetical protein
MTVVQYEAPPPLPPSQPGDELQRGPTGAVARLRAAAEYASHIADTDFVPQAIRGNRPEVTAVVVAGAELGLPPMVALRTIVMIRGRSTMTAEGLRGLVTSAGHELWIEESTTTRCIAAGRRQSSDRVGRVTWTLDDAKRAGIGGGENWRRYPAAMLVARATAALARQMFADVTLGIPSSEEIDDEPDNGAPAVPQAPPPKDAATPPAVSRTRKRRTPPTPPPEPEERGPVTPTPTPDDQPTPPATPPDPAAEPPATDAQKRQIFALMRDVGLTGDREARFAYTIRIVGRELASSNELTIREAGLVIDDLQEIAKLPAGEERDRRLLGEKELAALEQLDRLAGEKAESGGSGDEREAEPVPYNEFPEGF